MHGEGSIEFGGALVVEAAAALVVDDQIAPARGALTARAARWATVAVSRDARPVADVAAELGCDWHTANRAVLTWGEALLAADCARVGAVRALGLDETLFGRHGRWRTRSWCTSIVDVHRSQLLDIVPGRDAEGPTAWLLAQPEAWRRSIDWGCWTSPARTGAPSMSHCPTPARSPTRST